MMRKSDYINKRRRNGTVVGRDGGRMGLAWSGNFWLFAGPDGDEMRLLWGSKTKTML